LVPAFKAGIFAFMVTSTNAEFVPLHQAAMRLGVPIAWLKAEADAGRVPHLRAGRRLLFKLALVGEALTQRAADAAADREADHA
jgi:hypothetical protein